MSFKQKWFETVKRKNTVLCAGVDPAVFEMKRGEQGLPKGTDKKQWAFDYVKAIASRCAAIKYNINSWKGPGDLEALIEIYNLAKSLDLVVIDDSKLADIGASNESGIFYSKQRADAVTYSPFAGNIREAAEQAKKWDIGIIVTCLMSNPEHEEEKGK